MVPRRVLALAGLAFFVGLVLGAVVFDEGSPAQLFPSDDDGPRPRIRIENVGTHDLVARVSVAEANRAGVWSDTWPTPAGATTERTVDARTTGQVLAQGRFTWSADGRSASGDYTKTFEAHQCGARAVVVVFRIDTTRGISSDGGETLCFSS